MRIIAHEMADGSVARVVSFEIQLAWLMAARTPEARAAFIVRCVELGANAKQAARVMAIEGNPKDPRFTPEFAARWTQALAEGLQSEADALDLVARHAVPNSARYVLIDDHEMTDEIAPYRSALKLDGDKLGWNEPKMRDIHRARLRNLRQPKMAALDVDFMRALESGDTKAVTDVAALKQALRDAPADPAIEAATTPQELAAAIPAALRV